MLFGDKPRGPAALLLLVDVLVGRHAHLHHQRQELLEVDGFVLIDIQLFEPGVHILLLED